MLERTPRIMTRSRRLQRLVCAAVLGLVFGELSGRRVRGEEAPSDPYDALSDVLMTRYGPDGKAYGKDETSPAIWRNSEFPFGDRTYEKFSAALGAFAALSQAEIEAYGDVKRALLQRHLWKVLDATTPHGWVDSRTGEQRVASLPRPDRRAAVERRIASLIRRLALTRKQIQTLPNTCAATVGSGAFASVHDPEDLFKPFLPTDLYSKESSWVCLGEAGAPIPTDEHSAKFKWRSAFVSFMSVPGGRLETLKSIEKLNRNGELPVGTRFALVEQAFLISDDCELILSPLIVSVSLRAYTRLSESERTKPSKPFRAIQSVAEFVMQPRELMQGNAVMKALKPGDYRYEIDDTGAMGGLTGVEDVFETGSLSTSVRHSRLHRCGSCHFQAKRSRPKSAGLRTARVALLREGSPEAIIKATSTKKREHDTWKKLDALWQADSKKEVAQASTQSNQPQQRLDNNEPATRGAEDAAKAVPRSEFDKLFDVLMVRQARNKVAYGENEIAPMIFQFSKFPFDDATYPRLTAALDAITPETIRTYSNVQRAILQRQLWAVFDATTPSRFVTRRPDHTRRLAVQKQLAGLIHQLALKRTEIESLPDPLLTTVQAKKYPTEFDLDEPTSPFLPPDLTEDSSPWICFGAGRTPVNLHATDGRWRSAFFQFIRLPGEQDATIEYINDWNKQKVFPAGTQVALVEKAFLVSDKGEIVLSPMTVSTQLRAYRNVEQSFRDAGTATQCVAEFISRPRDYLRGDSLMAAVSPTDHRLKTVRSDGGKQDVLELVNAPKTSVLPRLGQCMNCHGGAGTNSLGDVVAPRGTLKSLQRRSQGEIVHATAKSKRDDKSWKILQELWRAESQKDGIGRAADENIPVAELAKSSDTGSQPPKVLATSATVDEEKAADPYDVLYDVIMVRKGPEKRAYGRNEVGPFIYRRSQFPFDDETFPKLTAALERFNALSKEEIESYGTVKRALLQRHLWAVFDATMPRPDSKPPTHLDRRRKTQKMLATLIGRVALTKDEILALPDTRAATLKSGYPQQHDPMDPFKPFLPADLYAKDSSWVCLGKVDQYNTDHAGMARWRSAFFQFVRLPDGREATLEYIKKLNAREVFPVGTQFALIEQAFLASDEGKLVLSPLINSIQLRAYLNVTLTELEARPDATQCVAEFIMQPRQLMQGKAAMKAVGPEDRRYKTFDGTGGRVDRFEDHGGGAIRRIPPRLHQCINCHGRNEPGVRSLGDFMHGDRIANRLTFEAGSPIKIAQAIATVKREDETWKKLQEFRRANESEEDVGEIR